MASPTLHSRFLRRLLAALPWLVLSVGLLVTWFAWQHERQIARDALRSQFDFALRETVSRIEQRVQGYEQTLRGVQSLFATTSFHNREAFRDYVDLLQLDANFSGIQAVGLVERVPASQLATHLSSMRRSVGSHYAITPAGARDTYTPIVQREPYVGINRAPVGVDIWPIADRRLALEKARDSGMPSITGKLKLLINKDNPAAPPGFVMYLPVYANQTDRSSVAKRREHLVGWVYASFHMGDFMASLYGRQEPGLTLAIYDGTEPDDATLMYRTPGNSPLPATPALSALEYLVVAGHNWTLSLSSRPEFEARYRPESANQTAQAGVVLSLMLTLLVWLTINGRAQAMRLAEAMTEQLRHAAQHDALTGLPNRALFADRLNQEILRAQRYDTHFALVFLDLDSFKPINDNFVHAVGDQVLQQVAQRLQKSVRAEDTVGRVGGDEFVMLLAGLSTAEDISGLTEKIRTAVRLPIAIDGREMHISCSMGVAVYPQGGRDAIALTKSADDAMYRAKSEGRDCIRVDGV